VVSPKKVGDLKTKNLSLIEAKVVKFIFIYMVKNNRVFELKIEEDDELSGIDSISLVDEPAIEAVSYTHLTLPTSP
jgi:hypothetical protein